MGVVESNLSEREQIDYLHKQSRNFFFEKANNIVLYYIIIRLKS